MGRLRAALARGHAVLVAEPGAGKTTVVPLRLLGEPWLGDGRIVVLEPRRVAARAAAARMASLLGEEVGDRVGFTTRDERRRGPRTRVEVVTEGVLTRRIQSDPGLTGVGLVVFDEFHERNLAGDLGLALTLDSCSGLRTDLRVLVMSATIDPGPVAGLLGGAEVITSPGRGFPVEVRWAGEPGRGRRAPAGTAAGATAVAAAAAVTGALERHDGDVLVFLPGAAEIAATARVIGHPGGVDVLPLHGGLASAEQDRALRPAARGRRVVLSTDVAESSVTVQGVRVVVDAGLARRPRYDPASGLTRLVTVPAARASSDQRAGRAGRQGPGVAYRLWTEAEHSGRRAWTDPEIAVADLAGLVLELAVWGAGPGQLRWLDPPPSAAVSAARALLGELGALDGDRPTELGRRMAEVPAHPRLAAMLLAAAPAGRRTAARLAALLGERDVVGRRGAPTGADVAERLALLDREGTRSGAGDPAALATVRRRAEDLLRRSGPARSTEDGEPLVEPGPLLAQAYPDRLAQARGSGRFRLRTGSGASLSPADPLVGAEWLVAAEVTGTGGPDAAADGVIRLAAVIDRVDVERAGAGRITTTVRLEWDPDSDDLRAVTERTLGALVLGTVRGRPAAGAATTAALVTRAMATGLAPLGWNPRARRLQARAGWARRSLGEEWPDVSDAALTVTAAEWLSPLLTGATGRADLGRVDPAVAIRAALGGRAGQLDRLLPEVVPLPGGRTAAVDYYGETPRISVRAQHLFGMQGHPTVAGGRVPVTVEILSPAGRPIQVTADLPGFWAGSWAQVRREMAGRYPKHDWPADPATAAADPAPRRPSRR